MPPTPDQRFERLSPRQRECLRLVFARKRTKEIADALGLSVGTVSTYCTEAIRILGARDRIDAAEQLVEYETQTGPSKLEPPSEGVGEAPPPTATLHPGTTAPWWRGVGRNRLEGAPHNDLGFFARLICIPLIALVCALAFGMVASSVRVASDLVAGRAPD